MHGWIIVAIFENASPLTTDLIVALCQKPLTKLESGATVIKLETTVAREIVT